MIDFHDYLDLAIEEFTPAQDKFVKDYKINDYTSWYYDQASGVFTFSNDSESKYFAFQNIGSFAPKVGTWLWSWANNNTYPNVKKDSKIIQEFGLKNSYEKLTKEYWEAEEVDGWNMLAIANKLLKPIGVYRVPTDGILMFLIFSRELTKEEAQILDENKTELIECDCHGMKRPAFVCQHLDLETPRGFNEAFETWKDMELDKDDDFQAWCDECEKVRVKYNGWNDESEEFAKIKLICEGCYFEMKDLNN